MPRLPRVSIIIVHRNRNDDFSTCLASLERQTEQDFEIIIVDTASTKLSLDNARRKLAHIRIIEASASPGVSEAYNIGIAAARGEWIAILDSDGEPDPRWLESMLRVATSGGPRLGMVQPKIVRRESGRTLSTGLRFLRHGGFGIRAFNWPNHADEVGDEIFCVSAGAALYRQSMLREARLPTGFFDPQLLANEAALDLGWRCRLAGWSARYASNAIVYQAPHQSQGESPTQQSSPLRVILKNGSAELFFRSASSVLQQFFVSARHEGINALPRYWEEARDALGDRREINVFKQSPRRCVERRWAEYESTESSPPRISIIISSYNYGRFLADAIESAFAQTLPPIEVIVVDDGSTDDSRQIARNFPVRLIEQENAGVCAARNRGVREAAGDYLVFLDADDILEPNYLSRCWDALRTAPRNVAYAYTQMRYFGSKTGIHKSAPFSRKRILQGNLVNVSALMKRHVFDEVGGFNEECKLGLEDADLWVRFLAHGHHGVLVPEPLLRYRRHGRSRNTLSRAELDALNWERRMSYPRLYWADLLFAPAKAARTLLRRSGA